MKMVAPFAWGGASDGKGRWMETGFGMVRRGRVQAVPYDYRLLLITIGYIKINTNYFFS